MLVYYIVDLAFLFCILQVTTNLQSSVTYSNMHEDSTCTQGQNPPLLDVHRIPVVGHLDPRCTQVVTPQGLQVSEDLDPLSSYWNNRLLSQQIPKTRSTTVVCMV